LRRCCNKALIFNISTVIACNAAGINDKIKPLLSLILSHYAMFRVKQLFHGYSGLLQMMIISELGDCYMIEEIMPGFYRIEVILPRNPLKVLNAYLVKGQRRNLLIDTGFNMEESKKALFENLKTLEVNLEQTDIFLTHLHPDHSGLISAVATESSVIYCGELDAYILNATHTASYWAELKVLFGLHGFPKEDIDEVVSKHPGCNYNPDRDHVFSFVKDGYILEVGGYRFHCVETPGHTPGHVCLYEPEHKILISGDHILDDISSNISELGIEDPLGNYLRSLEKIERLDIRMALPGHRRVMFDVHRRIAELKKHHDNRLGEVLSILKEGPANAYQVAARMTWDFAGSWEEFPLSQKWFAAGEAIAHLLCLYNRNQLRITEIDRKLAFALIY
jgi:glyoxylase-like metal-dependent hydrolase (beta-lactamase superfamily II)